MVNTLWVQFSWNLEKLPSESPKIDSRYVAESATLDEREELVAMLTRSYMMESGWGHDLKDRLTLVDEIVNTDFPANEVSFLAVKHGPRIIAATAIRDMADKLSNFPVGVCVLNEYRCRGLGLYLLYDGLKRLRERDLTTACLITKKALPAERFLYRKYESVRLETSGVRA